MTGGIYIVPASGMTAKVSIDHSQTTGNYFGIVADGRSGGIIQGVIKDSFVSGSSQNGITAHTSRSSVRLIVDDSVGECLRAGRRRQRRSNIGAQYHGIL